MDAIFGVGILVFAVLGAFFLVVAIAASRYKKVGPNEVLVISGRTHRYLDPVSGDSLSRNYRIVKGGGTVVLPVIERMDDLSLEIMTIDVATPKVYTSKGVALTVDGVAQVKVRGDDVSIATAAEQFLSKSTDEIKNVALQTLEGHQRAILGTLSVTQIYKDRDAFAQKVLEVAADDLAKMGLQIVSFTIRDISDDQGHLDALGQARTAEVKRDAKIGQANADRDASIEAAKAESEARIEAAKATQNAVEAEYESKARQAESEKKFSVEKAAYDAEVNRRQAESEQAFHIQIAIEKQKVRAEELQIEVIEGQKGIQVQQQEALRRERELEATVRRPAEAERFRIQTIAEAQLYEREAEAKAEAAVIKARGEAEAAIIIARGEAEAKAAQMQGLAQARIIQAQGEAEASAMRQKADAWGSYNQAAILDKLLDQLPAIAAAVSEPLSKTEKIVVIGGGGENGTGVNRITQDVTQIIAQMPEAVEALTGIDILSSLQNLVALKGATVEPKKTSVIDVSTKES